MIEITDVTNVYKMGRVEVQALRGVSLSHQQGEWVALLGPSGSGRSTLMTVIGSYTHPNSARYTLGSLRVDTSPE